MKFHKTYRLCTVLILFTVIVAFNVYAAGPPWDEHADPFGFLFGNHFDTHQQSKVNGGKDKLVGFLYIEYTDGTEGAEYGLSDAVHGTDTVGWVLDGHPVEEAVLIEHTSGEHPVWCLDPEDIPRSKGYTHFHWEGPGPLMPGETYNGYLLKSTAIDSFYFSHGSSSTIVIPGIDYISHENIEIDESGDNCGLF